VEHGVSLCSICYFGEIPEKITNLKNPFQARPNDEASGLFLENRVGTFKNMNAIQEV